jgi:hypothetical protein
MKHTRFAVYELFAAVTLLAGCGTGKPVAVSIANEASSAPTIEKTDSENSTPSTQTADNSTPKTTTTETKTVQTTPQPTPQATPQATSQATPQQTQGTSTEPPNLQLTSISIPSSAEAGKSLSVSASITNSGGPAPGLFAVVTIKAQVLGLPFGLPFQEKKNVETKETIPSGQSTKTFSFALPSAAKGVKGNVCVTAYSDAQHTKAISAAICRDVSIQ